MYPVERFTLEKSWTRRICLEKSWKRRICLYAEECCLYKMDYEGFLRTIINNNVELGNLDIVISKSEDEITKLKNGWSDFCRNNNFDAAIPINISPTFNEKNGKFGLQRLANLENHCFINSIFQMLWSSPSLYYFMDKQLEFFSLENKQFVHEVRNTFLTVNSASEDICGIKNLRDLIPGLIEEWENQHSQEPKGVQHDASEFLHFILELLDSELLFVSNESLERGWHDVKSTATSRNEFSEHQFSPLKSLIEGQLQRVLKDGKKIKGNFVEPFVIYDVNCGGSVEELITFSCEPQRLEGATRMITQQKVNFFPPVLFVQVNRIFFRENKLQKNKEATIVNESIRLKSGKNLIEYNLCSIICHIGHEITAGHYLCYARRQNEWYLLDDFQFPRSIPFFQVQKAAGETCALLLYECSNNARINIYPIIDSTHNLYIPRVVL